jgi:hypothetical protein
MFLLEQAVRGTQSYGIFVANVKSSPLHMVVEQVRSAAQLAVGWLSEGGGA